jgi:hypothetical protein
MTSSSPKLYKLSANFYTIKTLFLKIVIRKLGNFLLSYTVNKNWIFGGLFFGNFFRNANIGQVICIFKCMVVDLFIPNV